MVLVRMYEPFRGNFQYLALMILYTLLYSMVQYGKDCLDVISFYKKGTLESYDML